MNERSNTVNRACAGKCPNLLPTEQFIAKKENVVGNAIRLAVSDVTDDPKQVEIAIAILEKPLYVENLEPRSVDESSANYVRRCMGIMATEQQYLIDYYQGVMTKYTAGCDGLGATTTLLHCNSINKDNIKLPFK